MGGLAFFSLAALCVASFPFISSAANLHASPLGGSRPALLIRVLPDLVIGFSFTAIASMLISLGRRERMLLRFRSILLPLGAFVLFCGFTHLLDVVLVWIPLYWMSGSLKLVSAVASALTALALPSIIPSLHRLLLKTHRVRANDLRFRSAVESSLDAFAILQTVRSAEGSIEDFRISYLNENAAQLLGGKSEDFVGKLVWETISFRRDSAFFARCAAVAESGTPENFESQIGSDRISLEWMCSQIVKLEDGVAITLRDITGQKQIEQRLQASLETVRESESRQRSVSGRLLLANEVAAVGVWEWDVLTDALTWDATMEKLYLQNGGLPPAQYALWMQTIHPSDRVEVESVLRTVITDGKPSSIEFRILRPDGSIRYISSAQGCTRDEAGKVTRVVGVNTDITDSKLSVAHISHLAHHDSLTGLPNRELLQDRLRVCLDRARRYRTRVGLLVIDLDSFKKTNDSLGHRAGDEVLKIAAARLRSQFRTVDTVARIGGDEFVALLPDLIDMNDAYRLGSKALAALQEPMIASGQEVSISASIGVVVFPDDGQDPEMLLHNADTAMYFAKSAGKGNIQVFTAELDQVTARKNRMEDALRQAIKNQEFQLVYQPQISLSSDTVTGVEALIRWHSATLGTVMPLDFITLAEETGLIIPIGEWVLRTACRDAVTIQKMAGRPINMAVNLSPRQFQQENLSEMISSVLAETGLSPSLLEVEITENMLITDSSSALIMLNKIRDLGVRLAIDDFGTGFSSMSYIIKFDVDRLKIDRSFISDATSDSSCRTVTKAIIGLAHDLKIAVIAEGVETEDQRRFLLRQGCNEAQGYLFSRPRTLHDLPPVFAAIESASRPQQELFYPAEESPAAAV